MSGRVLTAVAGLSLMLAGCMVTEDSYGSGPYYGYGPSYGSSYNYNPFYGYGYGSSRYYDDYYERPRYRKYSHDDGGRRMKRVERPVERAVPRSDPGRRIIEGPPRRSPDQLAPVPYNPFTEH